ncbi:hypothetical protein Nepgr_025965 [Nepenthes gracilis]|uniref:Uncharacterized protein n=1 Tax=Nepenthes gracilis TaxID=150966 RepID=A0AAD3T8U8_NEPGR|nr:hypothetical protein Nepgr_025965 [Nepenthes gracilis]
MLPGNIGIDVRGNQRWRWFWEARGSISTAFGIRDGSGKYEDGCRRKTRGYAGSLFESIPWRSQLYDIGEYRTEGIVNSERRVWNDGDERTVSDDLSLTLNRKNDKER